MSPFKIELKALSMRNLLLKPVLACIAWMLFLAPAHAIDIKEVISPGGIKAWLVESKTVPLIAMDFSFEGGSSSDAPGKEGTANFITGMMDEGAGDMSGSLFQARRDELAVKISFDAGKEEFEGSLQTLSKNKDAAFALLKMAITKPHFDAVAMERVRQQFLASARDSEQDPDKIASAAWMKVVFGNQNYARETNGTSASIPNITPDDLRAMHKLLFTRKGLKVAVVGDIDVVTLGKALDEIFGGLRDSEPPKPQEIQAQAKGPIVKVIDRDIPQSVIVFGQQGILRNDADFIPAYIMSHILGGGGFSSLLTNEVREKRGLTYGVDYSLAPLDHAGLYIGSVSTRNEKAGEAISVVKDVLQQMAKEGPTQSELDNAKTFLTGSYALRFDSNGKIAGQLLGIQQQGLGIDYINTRNAKITAVTLDQVKAQAKRLIDSSSLIVTAVGKPEGLKSTGSGG
jgi:zinc protease